MTLESLKCPNCAAPLHLGAGQRRTLCLYCGSTVYFNEGEPAVQPQTTPELPPAALDQIKQLLVDGRRVEALHFYQQQAGVTEAEAAATLDNLIKSMTRRALLEQPISTLGLLIVFGVDVACLAALLWGLLNGNWLVVAIAVVALLFESLTFVSAIRARILQEFGAAAPALVRKFIRLGEIKLRGEPEPTPIVRLWLEVRPSEQSPFQVEKNVVIRKQSLERLEPGVLIEVRYNRSGHVVPVAPMIILGMSSGVDAPR